MHSSYRMAQAWYEITVKNKVSMNDLVLCYKYMHLRPFELVRIGMLRIVYAPRYPILRVTAYSILQKQVIKKC